IFPQKHAIAITELSEHMSAVRGKHTLKTGINVRLYSMFRESFDGVYPNVNLIPAGSNPPASFGPSGAMVISIADRARFEQFYNHLLGHIGTVRQRFYSDLSAFQPAGTPRVRNYRNREYHAFVQDDWKLRPNLTLNLGLRYEWNGPPFERDGLQGTLDRAAQINPSSQMSDLTIQRTSRWFGPDWNNFAPRVGLAWDPKADGRTAIRASYGIYYDALAPAAITFADANTPGFTQLVEVLPNINPGSDIRLSDDYPLPAVPPAPQLQLPAERTTNIAVFDPRLRTGYVQQYSFSIQREVARGTVVEAAFVGNRGVKLFMQVNPNQRKIEGDFLQAFRELQAFWSNGTPVSAGNTLVRLFGSVPAAITGIGGAGLLDRSEAGAAADTLDLNRNNYGRYTAAGISQFYIRNFPQYNILTLGTNEGRSYYDSLQLSLRRRGRSMRFDLNYTWSKSIDTISSEGEAFDGLNPPNVAIDSFNIRLNRARSDADRPHVFTALAVWSLPVGRGRRFGANWTRWVDWVAGGWETGVLGIRESGGAFSVRSGRQTAGTFVPSFANFTGDRNAGGVARRGDGVYWFSPQEIPQFSFPAAGEIGTSGRNAFRGPRFFNIDVSLVKNFVLTERHRIVLRGEAYNLLNNVNFANPEANLSTRATLGRISSTVRGITGAPLGEPSGGPRIIQLALRWAF
ncbi:MAG TPA: TonB-dependent receptor, partial [Bryobacteraceae bacterium]|nr:TonB-dependent receptor [Bryobacteraceae bacterium]